MHPLSNLYFLISLRERGMARTLDPRAKIRHDIPIETRVPMLEGDVDELESDLKGFSKKLDRIIYLLLGILVTMVSSLGTVWAGGIL